MRIVSGTDERAATPLQKNVNPVQNIVNVREICTRA
jgi:hypothetical protein